MKTTDGKWQPLGKARFTGDGNPVMNIDGGAVDGRLFLATGGEIENKTTPLWKSAELDTAQWPPAPVGLPIE